MLLAPGTTDTGPERERRYLLGRLLLRGPVPDQRRRRQRDAAQPGLDLFIEDAIEETKTSTASISAEYGRFAGGVANIITKSGGNEFSGSFRTTFANDKWHSLTPFEEDARPRTRASTSIVPTYEADARRPDRQGQAVVLRRGALSRTRRERPTDVLHEHRLSTNTVERQALRGQAAPGRSPPSTRSRASFTKRTPRRDPNNSFGDVMDLASFYDNSRDRRTCCRVNYTGVLSPELLRRGPVLAARKLSFDRLGLTLHRPRARHDDPRPLARQRALELAHLLRRVRPHRGADRGGRAERGEARQPERHRQGLLLPVHLEAPGSHNLVFGFDAFEDSRKNNNYQSGSGFRLFANNTIIRGEGDNVTLYPGRAPRHLGHARPRPPTSCGPRSSSPARGSQLRTYSAFFNDAWRLQRQVELQRRRALRQERTRRTRPATRSRTTRPSARACRPASTSRATAAGR